MIKKLFLTIVLMAWCGVAGATTYNICAACGAGRQTIADVNSLGTAGDIVAFNKGESFSGQFAGISGVHYTSYGVGALPIIQSARISATNLIEIDNLYFGSTTIHSVQITQGAHDLNIHDVSIDCASQNYYAMLMTGSGAAAYNIKLKNLTVTNCSQGIEMHLGTHDVSIEGGTFHIVNAGGHGLGIQAYDNTYNTLPNYNINVDGVKIYCDSGSCANEGINIGYNTRNFNVKHSLVIGPFANTFVQDSYNNIGGNSFVDNIGIGGQTLLLVGTSNGYQSNNLTFVYNTLIPTSYTTRTVWYRTPTGGSGNEHIFKNNIIISLLDHWPNIVIDNGFVVDSDYNLFYNAEVLYMQYGSNYAVGGIQYTTVPTWFTGTGLDAHSVQTNSNPLLDSTYRPVGASPAINAGVCLSDVTDDYVGMHRPWGAGCDIGAYETITGITVQ